MISDSTYHEIWDGLLEVCRVHRYSILCKQKYQRLAMVFRFLLAISGIGVLASLIEFFYFLPASTIVLFGILISVLIILDLIIQPSKTAAQLIIVTSMLSDLEGNHRKLWEEVKADLISDKEALSKKNQIMLELRRVSSLVEINVNDKYNEIAQTEAFQTEEARYAG